MWVLDAVEVWGVDKNEEYISGRNGREQELRVLQTTTPEALEGRTIRFIAGDMTRRVKELPDDHFDLAFCQGVLYQVFAEGCWRELQNAVHEMARVVRPGSWVVAVEPDVGIGDVEPGCCLEELVSRAGEGVDISGCFEREHLERVDISGAPRGTYGYRKRRCSAGGCSNIR
jgi:SAM-dependent methyltransferase